MGPLNGLRLAGRSGSKCQVGQIVRRDRHARSIPEAGAQRIGIVHVRRVGQFQTRDAQGRVEELAQHVGRRPRGPKQNPRARRSDPGAVDQPGGRIVRVQDGKGGTRFERSQQRTDQRRTAGPVDGHHIPGPHAVGNQPVGQPVAPSVQVPVGEGLFAKSDSDLVRSPAGMFRKAILNGTVPGRLLRLGGIRQSLLAYRRDKRKAKHVPIGILDDFGQQLVELLEHFPHPFFPEQVDVVDQSQVHSLTNRFGVQSQVEQGGRHQIRQGFQHQVGQPEPLTAYIDHIEEDLEERSATQVPIRLQTFHQPLEREVLTCERFHRNTAHAGQQFPISGIARKACSQDQCVQEATDQTLHFLPVAPFDRRAYHDILLARVAAQQSLKHGEQRHERSHAFPRIQRFQFFPKRLRKKQLACLAPMRLHRRTRLVGGKL